MTNGIKICDLKPSARLLYSLAGKEGWIAQEVRVDNEYFALGWQIKELTERIENEIGPDVASDIGLPWPANQRLVEALRLCLHDYPGSHVSEQASRLLLRCGYFDRDIIDSLNPWDSLMFKWKEAGVTVDKLERLLLSAGVQTDISPVDREKIQSWISSPLSATFSPYGTFAGNLLEILLGSRCIQRSLDSEISTPAELFISLFRGLNLEAIPANAEHCYDWHWQEHLAATYAQLRASETSEWLPYYEQDEPLVSFKFRGIEYVFFAGQGSATRVDEKIVLANFDAFMKGLGRQERAYRIDVYREWWHEGVFLVVGEPQYLEPAMAALHIPLLSATTSAGCTIDFGLGQGPIPYAAKATVHLAAKQ